MLKASAFNLPGRAWIVSYGPARILAVRVVPWFGAIPQSTTGRDFIRIPGCRYATRDACVE
eukprot:9790689-Alexandrium_andersonii.AAC.1